MKNDDFPIQDTPPQIGLLATSVVSPATEVIAPVEMDGYTTTHVAHLIQQIHADDVPGIDGLGLLPS